MDNQQQPTGGYKPPQPPTPQPGEGLATAAMIFGIVSLVFFVINWFIPFGEVFFGIIGIILATMAKKRGYVGSKNTAGLVCSIITVILGGIYWAACMIICHEMVR